MKSRIFKIKENWKPKLIGPFFSKKEQCSFMSTGHRSGSLWEAALNKERKKYGWIEMPPNSQFDALAFFKDKSVRCETRTVSQRGVDLMPSSVSGSKGTTKNKLTSYLLKQEMMGDDGIYAFIDIVNAGTTGANVYLITVKDLVQYFGKETFHITYPQFMQLVKNRCIDRTKNFVFDINKSHTTINV